MTILAYEYACNLTDADNLVDLIIVGCGRTELDAAINAIRKIREYCNGIADDDIQSIVSRFSSLDNNDVCPRDSEYRYECCLKLKLREGTDADSND